MKKMTGRAALSLVLALALLCRPLFPAFAGTYDIGEGSVEIHAATDTQTVRQDGKEEVKDADPVVTGSTTENTLTITADKGAEAKVTFDGLTATMPKSENDYDEGTAAVTVKGEGSVTVELDGDSSLTSGNVHAGLEKQNGGRLTIADDNGDDGSLAAVGGTLGAGIGSVFNPQDGSLIGNGSDIVITGGTVTATGGDFGAGIGGGYRGSGEDITISGGTVTATGGYNCAGIGGGERGSGTGITISGGTVTATGNSGAGIGGGADGSGTGITISGGDVVAVGIYSGAGIGAGRSGGSGDIDVTGAAQVQAAGGSPTNSYFGSGAAIGGGGSASPKTDGAEDEDAVHDLTCGSVLYYGPGTTAEQIRNGEATPVKTVEGSGHQFAAGWSHDAQTHWHACTNDGCTVKDSEAAHSATVEFGAKAPTCTEDGLRPGLKCSVCGYVAKQPETDPATGHNWDTQWSSDGSRHWHKCLNDGCAVTSGEAEHSPEEFGAKAPTCTEDGLRPGLKCSVCGYVVKQPETDPATGHNWDTQWSSDGSRHWHKCLNDGCAVTSGDGEHTTEEFGAKAPTCTEDGLRPGLKCSVCGYVAKQPETDPATGHNWDTQWSSDGSRHWHKCLNDGCAVTSGDGEHTTEEFGAKAPTCTEDGLRPGLKCSVCGYVVKQPETDPATGHSWDTQWSSDGSRHWHKCLNDGCAVTSGEAEHVHEVIPAVEPTCTRPGQTEGERCAVCGELLKAPAALPATGHSMGVYRPAGEGRHKAACTRCGLTAAAACEMITLPGGARVCPVCGEGDGISMAPVTGGRAVSGAPGGRMTAFASADGWLVLAFESDGRLLKPRGAVTFTLPASMLDGKKLLLADGSEAAYEVSGGKARFTASFSGPAAILRIE